MSCNDLIPLWSKYFEESVKLSSFRLYLTRPRLFLEKKQQIHTFFIMHHGAGSCGLTFAYLAKEITSMTNSECGVLAYDMRGHGDSDDIIKDGTLDLRLEELCKDFVQIVELVKEYLQCENTLELILVGHSLGGAVLAHVAKNQLVPNIFGCIVLDMVEGSVISSFSTIIRHLSKRPKFFISIQECIDWHLKNKIIKNEQSAQISVPMLLKKQTSQNGIHDKWIWRVDLNETGKFWHHWFSGLSDCFLAIPSAKLLILSNTDRLDKTLMIAQMQGKFQLITFQNTGHFLHEDSPLITAKTLISFWQQLGLFIFGFIKFNKFIGIWALEKVEMKSSLQLPEFKSTVISNAVFVEQFTSDWKSRWTISSAMRRVDGNNTLFYDGEWKVEEPTVYKGINGDTGLVVKKAAAHHAISAKFLEPINNEGKILVVQYEVKLQNELECGGAYLKLITASNEDIRYKDFSDRTPYTIMFGPDKCGSTNKVHFIFRHKNPLTGKYQEKHLQSPPAIENTKVTTLYTLIVRPDQAFEIRINNKAVKTGNLLTDFIPPVNPAKYIPDPDDRKPLNWVEESMIVDVNAKKPDDWDENEPLEIIDVNAIKPANWLEHEPLMIPDPNVQAPDEWDEEEDGKFTGPMIPNPACVNAAGCGPFRPMIRNPKYKGKWVPPLINNPKYIGEWKPRDILNPNYYEDKTPSNFESLIGIGFELWTMQNDILFDNIYIGHSIEEAEKFAESTFGIKYKNEITQETGNAEEEKVSDNVMETSYLDVAMKKVVTFIDLMKEDPISALKKMPGTASTLGTLFLTLIAIFYGIISLVSTYSRFNSTVEPKNYKQKAMEKDGSKLTDSNKANQSNETHDSSELDTTAKKRTKHAD
ncbi:hypothetical protein PCANB_001461 [Pneumocystis canis]|nr:hypothetical protein PCANB_001461 [Pneumocystis canis]